MLADCVVTGTSDYVSKPVIVHANDGSRVSCGLLPEEQEASPTPVPSGSASVSTKLAVWAAVMAQLALAFFNRM